MPTLVCMPQKKSSKDKHKPRRMAAVPERMAVQLDKLVDLNGSSFTEEVRHAIREYLQKHNLWPKQLGESSQLGDD